MLPFLHFFTYADRAYPKEEVGYGVSRQPLGPTVPRQVIQSKATPSKSHNQSEFNSEQGYTK